MIAVECNADIYRPHQQRKCFVAPDPKRALCTSESGRSCFPSFFLQERVGARVGLMPLSTPSPPAAFPLRRRGEDFQCTRHHEAELGLWPMAARLALFANPPRLPFLEREGLPRHDKKENGAVIACAAATVAGFDRLPHLRDLESSRELGGMIAMLTLRAGLSASSLGSCRYDLRQLQTYPVRTSGTDSPSSLPKRNGAGSFAAPLQR